MSQQTIDIDCAPGLTRPDVHMKTILEKSNLCLRYKKPTSVLFGNWEWDYSELNTHDWKILSACAKEVITTAFHNGSIRYGSW